RDGVMTTLFRSGDRFTTRYQEGSLIINVTGTVAAGKARVSGIHIQDGQQASNYDSVEKVPARYRDKVNHLIELSARGEIRIQGRGPAAPVPSDGDATATPVTPASFSRPYRR